MKLYEIDNSLRELWNKIIEQDGELLEEDMQALESLEIAKEEKVKGYGVVYREIVSDIAKVKEEIDRLKKIGKRLQSKADWLSSSLSMFMQNNGMKDYKSVEVNIGFGTSKSLYVEDESKLAKKWFRVKKVTEIDKQAIKDFIANGGKVKGCQIVEKQNIQIK